MTATVSGALLRDFGEFISTHLGLWFPPSRGRELEAGARKAAGQLGYPDAESCMTGLMSTPLDGSRIEVLASHLTVGETYFWREPRSFDALERLVLPPLLDARRSQGGRLRFWSAGCCTGEEPYTLAMLLDRLCPAQAAATTILATDINPHFLRRAAEGLYGKWSFRNPPDWLRQYFRATPAGRFELEARIRARVTFTHLNLARDPYPSLDSDTNAMDVIFCRNVLMYFTPALARRVVERFRRALVDGGWLIVSPTEASPDLFPGFVSTCDGGAILYRKTADLATPSLHQRAPFPLLPTEPFALRRAPSPSHVVPLPPRPAGGEPPLATPSPPHPLPAVSLAPRSGASSGAAPSTPGWQEATGLYRQGQYAAAATVLTHVLDEAPANGESGILPTEAWALLVRARANHGDLSGALAACESAVAADRLNPLYPYLRATLLQEQGEPEAAAASLRQALYLDGDFAMAWFALGHLRRRSGSHRDARKHLETALALLEPLPTNAAIPEAEDLTAGRLAEIIRATLEDATP